MKTKLLLLAGALILIAGKSYSQHFDASLLDAVGSSSYPYNAYIVEAEESNYYLFGGAWYEQLTHPMLPGISSDNVNCYFIKYDGKGNALWGKYITGLQNPVDAFVDKDANLWIIGSSYYDVSIEGNPVSLNGASYLEFVAVYNKSGNLVKYLDLWNLDQYQYAYSRAAFDQKTSSLYLYGKISSALSLEDGTVVGQNYNGFFYAMKFDIDLNRKWIFTAGFDQTGEGGYFEEVFGAADVSGNLYLTGLYDSYGSTLTVGANTVSIDYQNTQGLILTKISPDGALLWQKNAETGGTGNFYDGIHDGLAMTNGDMIFKATTTTGVFKLGSDISYAFDGGSGFKNEVLFRLDSDGAPVWVKGLATMTEAYQGKKATKPTLKAYNFEANITDKTILANSKLLVTAGFFSSDILSIAGSLLSKPYFNGIYVAGYDPETGAELWGNSFSSDYVSFHGLDCDVSGNVTLAMDGNTLFNLQNFGDINGYESSDPVIVGLDYDGNPYWYNFLKLESNTYGLYATDVEVLANGTILLQVNGSYADNMINGSQVLTLGYTYANYLLELRNNSSISGKVQTESGTAVTKGSVMAYYHNKKGSYPMADSVALADDGSYYLSGLLPGDYTLKCLADAATYPNAKPTYYVDKLKWADAGTITLNVGTVKVNSDITLQQIVPFTTADGSGEASGNLSYVDENVRKSVMGRPVVKASVVLVGRSAKASDGEVVAIIETDEEGNYIFDNIPDGLYRLEVDIPGLPMISSYDIVIENNTILFGLDFYVDTEEGISTTATYVPLSSYSDLKIYPNPGSGLITVATDDAGAELTGIEVYVADGRMIRKLSLHGSGELSFDISDLSRGLYLLKLNTSKGSEVIRYMLQ
ncbi:MAG: T9SS type A sorting domain-containing protein [Bacteroidota bacterium]